MASEEQNRPLEYPLLSDPPVPSAPSAPPLDPPAVVPCQSCTACKSCVKPFIWAYIALQLIVLVVQAITLAQKHWLRYCFWDFGLLVADSESHSFSDSGLIFSLGEEYCRGDWEHIQNEPISQYCQLFCINVWILGGYGIATLCVAVVSMVIALFPLGMHIAALVRPVYSPLLHWVLLAPCSLWLVACFVYYLGTIVAFFDTAAKRSHDDDHDELHTKVGRALWMALCVAGAQVFLFLFVTLFTRRAFEKRARD